MLTGFYVRSVFRPANCNPAVEHSASRQFASYLLTVSRPISTVSVSFEHRTTSRPDLSYFFANPDKIGNKLIFADYDSKYVLKYIWRVPHLEVHGK